MSAAFASCLSACVHYTGSVYWWPGVFDGAFTLNVWLLWPWAITPLPRITDDPNLIEFVALPQAATLGFYGIATA